MDPRERFDDALGAYAAVGNNTQLSIWTAMPGIVQSYNAAQGTVSVQITLRSEVQSEDGIIVKTLIPVLPDVPVCFPQGGNVVMTFPIAAGDECLVVFAARCIDSWWQSGGVQDQQVLRTHSLSDGFAIVGPRSRARAVGSVSASEAQMRSVDGAVRIGVDPATGRVNITAPGGVYINGINFDTHKHTGVEVGGGVSGGPTA